MAERAIIHCDGLTVAQEKGVIRLHDDLAPGATTRRVNIPMIWNKAIQVFIAMIAATTNGQRKLRAFMRYYNLEEVKPGKKPVKCNPQEVALVQSVIPILRTIENAVLYLDGFKEMMDHMEKLTIHDQTNDMSKVELIKIMRAYLIIFGNTYYFVEDGRERADGKLVNDVNLALQNNKLFFGPEVFLVWYEKKVVKILDNLEKKGEKMDKMFFIEPMLFELEMLRSYRPRLYKEVLRFAELKMSILDDGNTIVFESINQCIPNLTFGDVRKLKVEVISEEYPVFPVEGFAYTGYSSQLNFRDLFSIIKYVTMLDYNFFMKEDRGIYEFSGSRVVEKKIQIIRIFDTLLLAGHYEISRFINLFEYLQEIDFPMTFQEGSDEKYGVRHSFAAIKFAQDMDLLFEDEVPDDDCFVAEILLKRDQDKLLLGYLDNPTKENRNMIAEALGVDETLEDELEEALSGLSIAETLFFKDAEGNMKLCLDGNSKAAKRRKARKKKKEKEKKKAEKPQVQVVPNKPKKKKQGPLVAQNASQEDLDTILNYARERDWLTENGFIDIDLIETVVIKGNEEIIEKFRSGEIKEFTFDHQMKFPTQKPFLKMLFDIYSIDTKKIEDYIHQLGKTSMNIEDQMLLLKLYSYVMTSGVDDEGNPCPMLCGADNKKPRRSKIYTLVNMQNLIA